MIENIVLTGTNQSVELDRTKTQNYVLDTVYLGERDTAYTLVNTMDMIGVERDIWYKRLSVVEITGYVLADDKDAEAMSRRKMRLNRFVVPKTQMKILMDGQTELDFTVTESIRYGKTYENNNNAFCMFRITGLYR